MKCNFNTFIHKSDQKLAKDYFDSYPGRYTETKEWMFRFVCWLKNLDGEYSLSKIQTAIKTGTKALAILGMVILCPLVIGGFLLNWYSKAQRNVNCMLNDLRKLENEEFEKIIIALGIEKQGIEIPNIQNKPTEESIEDVFTKCNSPIFQCNGDFIALLIQDKKTKEKRIATIEKTRRAWEFKKLKSSRVSECHMASSVSSEYYRAIEFGSAISNLKAILKGKGEYDELAFDLIRKPKEELSLGGPCITEVGSVQSTKENVEMKKIIAALGGENVVKKIPILQKRPLSRERMAIFERLKSPTFQSGGNFISILLQDKETQERKIITVKKVKDEWLFRKFPLSYASWRSANSSTTRIQWLLDDGSITTRMFNGQTPAKQCETHIEFIEQVVGVSANKYKLATF